MLFLFGWQEVWMGTARETLRQNETVLQEHNIAFRTKQKYSFRPSPNRAGGRLPTSGMETTAPPFYYQLFVQKKNMEIAEFLLRKAELEQ